MRLPGLLAALAAMLLQVALATAAPIEAAALAGANAVAAAGVFCHTGDDEGSAAEHPAPAQRHDADCLLCPFCQAAAHPSPLSGPPPLVAPPVRLVAIRFHPAPPARAPPEAPRPAPYPRGPPPLR